jgi:hypothetical protein
VEISGVCEQEKTFRKTSEIELLFSFRNLLYTLKPSSARTSGLSSLIVIRQFTEIKTFVEKIKSL